MRFTGARPLPSRAVLPHNLLVRRADLTDEANRAAALAWRVEPIAAQREEVALFRARWLDVFTRVHPATPYVVGAPLIAWSLWVARELDAILLGALVLGGWLLWTLVEYAMHRFLFHLSAEGEHARIALLLAHGHHHVWPSDRRRIAATPVQLGSLLLLFSGLAQLSLGGARGAALFAGVVLGYVVYEAVHFMAHHGRPRSRLLRALKEHHLRHHHAAPRSRWGISSPLWDWVFRTHR